MRSFFTCVILTVMFVVDCVVVTSTLYIGGVIGGALFYGCFWLFIHVVGFAASAAWIAEHLTTLKDGMLEKVPQIATTLGIVGVIWSFVRTVDTWRAAHGLGPYPLGHKFLDAVLRTASPEAHEAITGDESSHTTAEMVHDVLDDVLDELSKKE